MSKKKEKNKIGHLFKSFKPYILQIMTVILLLSISVVFTILSPGTVRDLTNAISPVGATPIEGKFFVNENVVIYDITKLIIFITITFVTSFLGGFVLNTTVQKYSRDLREKVSHKINRLPLNYYDTTQTGDILSIVTNDIDTLATALQNSVTLILQAAMMVFGVIIAMFIACWQMAFVVLCSLPFIGIMILITFKKALPLFNDTQKVLAKVNEVIEENYSGQMVIKAFNAEERKQEQFEKENGKLGRILYKSQAFGGLIEPCMALISYATYAATMIVAGILFANGSIGDIGVITGFIIYISLFQDPLTQIGQAGNTVQLGLAACNRVFTFLENSEEEDDSAKPELLNHCNIQGSVEFQDVCFGYLPEKLTIKHFTKNIQPGMKVAIIGPTGAGKTTLVNLLMRFYEMNSGDIVVDGKSIQAMSRKELRSIFGMILQDTWVINGTVRENIVYNIPDVSEERIWEVLEETNLTHFVKTLPNGLDTVIKKDSSLSAGQKQLITIARAMIENAPMMILDEATSNVDTRTEIMIQKAMDKLTHDRTSFVIAHRLSTIKNADLILVMKDGNVIETGNHETLLKANGLYAEIYNSQFN